jgi:hypothetical protein
MNMYEFLDELFEIYSNSWKENNKEVKQKQYWSILDRPNVDFDKLLKIVAEEYLEGFIPPPAWLKDKIPMCLKHTEGKWQQVKVYNPIYKTVCSNDCFPKGTTIEQMIKTYEKKFNCTGWQILEVY